MVSVETYLQSGTWGWPQTDFLISVSPLYLPSPGHDRNVPRSPNTTIEVRGSALPPPVPGGHWQFRIERPISSALSLWRMENPSPASFHSFLYGYFSCRDPVSLHHFKILHPLQQPEAFLGSAVINSSLSFYPSILKEKLRNSPSNTGTDFH